MPMNTKMHEYILCTIVARRWWVEATEEIVLASIDGVIISGKMSGERVEAMPGRQEPSDLLGCILSF
jgi:hypothetical protein